MLNTCWSSVTTGRTVRGQRARRWTACIRKIFAKHWESSPKTNIRRKAGRRSSSVLLCCATVSSAPVIDLARLLDAVIFNFLVGNNDAHGKNFSLLYRGADSASLDTRLAPLYDLVSTRYYPELTRDLAMKIGGEYSSDRVSKANFEQLAEDAGLAKPLVRRRVPELAEAVLSNLSRTEIEYPVAEALAEQIRGRCNTL